MSGINLDEIEARAKAATPGPWVVSYDNSQASPEALGRAFAQTLSHGGLTFWGCVVPTPGEATPYAYPCVSGNGPTSEANARFLAAARNDVPALVAEVRRLRALLEKACGPALDGKAAPGA